MILYKSLITLNLKYKTLSQLNIKITLIFLALTSVFGAMGQTASDLSMFKPDNGGLEPKNYQKGLSNISVNGYYRFLGAYTSMSKLYPEMGSVKNTVFIGLLLKY